MLRSLYFLIPLLLLACQSNTEQQQASTPEDSGTPAQPVQPMPSNMDEDELITRLSQELIPNPTTQLEKEINEIVNYAIDNRLNVKRTPSGLFYQVTSIGNGPLIQAGERVTAHYRGSLLNGEEFDNSYDRGQPILFQVGGMIPGWDEGMTLVNPGSTMILLIPSPLAYGEEGMSDQSGNMLIPPNTPIRFDADVRAHFFMQQN